MDFSFWQLGLNVLMGSRGGSDEFSHFRKRLKLKKKQTKAQNQGVTLKEQGVEKTAFRNEEKGNLNLKNGKLKSNKIVKNMKGSVKLKKKVTKKR
jgi:hypothetical protein